MLTTLNEAFRRRLSSIHIPSLSNYKPLSERNAPMASIHYFMQISPQLPCHSVRSHDNIVVCLVFTFHTVLFDQSKSQNMIIIQKDLIMANVCSLYSYFGAKQPTRTILGIYTNLLKHFLTHSSCRQMSFLVSSTCVYLYIIML